MIILGLNAYHADAAACLIEDGQIIAAVEEERIIRIKHVGGFPESAIRECLRIAGRDLRDIDHVALNRNSKVGRWNRIGYLLRHWPSPDYVLARIRNRKSWASVADRLAEMGEFRGQVHNVEHHLAHLASTFLASPFERAVAVSIDGFGDFATASWGMGVGTSVGVDERIHFPHSLGIFYQAITQYLGFWDYGDEYKVMGLAAHGQPKRRGELAQLLSSGKRGRYRLNLKYFRHDRENVPYRWDGGAPEIRSLFSAALEELLGPARAADEPVSERHADIAASAQEIYEECLFALLRDLAQVYGEDRLTLAGGCAQNSLANGKILRETPFRELYIPPASADSGGALGAALHVWHDLSPNAKRTPQNHAKFGDAYSAAQIDEALSDAKQDLTQANCRVSKRLEDAVLVEKVAGLLTDGAVVGWFQGKMEWGPRALGNRSILADPRRANMRETLNAKIKRRESFQPFSPSVLAEKFSDWFELGSDAAVGCPFMSQVYPVRPERGGMVPAIVHIDGTTRAQAVHRDANPLYRDLIEAFERSTGIPMILNTSFNQEEPIVRTPNQALDCFLRSGMDALAIGPYLIDRSDPD
jgi:carbamoyltransferase